MAFDWRQYFHVADHLAHGEDVPFSKEAALRSSVSRAYYSAFCHARNYAEKNLKYTCRRIRAGAIVSEGDDHGALPNHYLKRGKNEIADPLKQLREQRNYCDYDDEVANLLEVAEECLFMAKDIINRLTFPPDQRIP